MSPAILEDPGTTSEQTKPGKNYIILKWNNFDSFLIKSLHELFNRNELTDVSLVCEDSIFRSHKVILAMWSPYFRDIFLSTPTKNPVIVLKDVSAKNMELLLGYIYQGEIFIQQSEAHQFLELAYSLKIIGIDETLRQTAAVIPDPETDFNEDAETERNLYWKPVPVSIFPNFFTLSSDTEPQTNSQELHSDSRIPEVDSSDLENQDLQSIEAEKTLDDSNLRTSPLDSAKLRNGSFMEPKRAVYASGHSESDEDPGQREPTIAINEPQKQYQFPKANLSSKCHNDPESGTQNDPLHASTKSQDDLENLSSIPMLNCYPAPATAVGKNVADLCAPYAEAVCDNTVKTPIITGKLTLLEKNINELGPNKRIRLEPCFNLNAEGTCGSVTSDKTGRSENNAAVCTQKFISKRITMNLRCSFCRINTYSKEAYEKHMNLHRKRGQMMNSGENLQQKDIYAQPLK